MVTIVKINIIIVIIIQQEYITYHCSQIKIRTYVPSMEEEMRKIKIGTYH